MEGYTTILEYSAFEYEDKRSVFIGEATPVSTEAQALSFIESVKRKYPDAKHHVYAYVLKENSIARFTDDREPQGTAGLPVLDVIRKNGVTDAVIVVTRYFGGTLLGTGGLVRAYTAAASGALNGAKIARYDIYTEMLVSVGYSDFQKLGSIIEQYGFRVEDTDYAENVKLRGSVLTSKYDEFLEKLTEATSGRLKCDKIREKFSY